MSREAKASWNQDDGANPYMDLRSSRCLPIGSLTIISDKE